MKNTALITWASSWIWLELAKIHAKKTWDLVLVARSLDKLEALKKELEISYNRNIIVISKDLTDINSPKELYYEVKKLDISVEYLINNAWFWWQWYFHERKWKDDKNMIQLNITSLTELTKYFVEDMVKMWKWKILNVSSTASYMPWPLQAVYYASKSFVQFFSNALSRELEWTGVTITNLMPWATATGFEKIAGLDNTKLFKKTSTAKWVAEDGYNGMIDWKLDIVSGLTFIQKIMMWILPFLPKKILLNMIYDMQKITK